jgi:hypothetical protein
VLNMSKVSEALTLRDALPMSARGTGAVCNGRCRPVLMEKIAKLSEFTDVSSTFLDGKAPSEIVLGTKPAQST